MYCDIRIIFHKCEILELNYRRVGDGIMKYRVTKFNATSSVMALKPPKNIFAITMNFDRNQLKSVYQ